MLRIGDAVYVIHTEFTCIKVENEENHPSPSEVLIENEIFLKEENVELPFPDSVESFDNVPDDSMDNLLNNLSETASEKEQPIQRPFRIKKDEKSLSLDELKRIRLENARKSKAKYNSTLVKCTFAGCDALVTKKVISHHMARHRGVRFDCNICTASLASRAGLRAHMLCHDPNAEREKCITCGSTFATKSGLSQHQRYIHLNEPKRFICSICGRALRKGHLLKEHMYKHTGEKPYKCTFCEKCFRTKTHRNEHQRVHTGEKPYKCDQENCDREFAYAVDFKRHRFNAHGICVKKFSCQICMKDFPENMLLKKHMKSHGVDVQ